MKMKLYIILNFLIFSLAHSQQNQFVIFDTTNSPIPSNRPMNLAIDNDGSYWFCFNPDWNGSNYVKGGLAKFDGTNWTIFNKDNSLLPTNFVNSIAIDRLGRKWVATDGGVMKISGNEWVIYNSQNSPLLEDYIWNVNIEGDSIVWISSRSKGFYRFDGVNWNLYNISNSPLRSDAANFVIAENNRVKWFGADRSPLFSFDGTNWQIHGQFPFAPGPLPGIQDPDVHSMAIEKDGTKWIVGRGWYGTNVPRYSAVAKFNQSGWVIFDSTSIGFTFVPNYWGLAIDTNNVKWITAYDKGLIKYDGTKFFVFDRTNSPFFGTTSIIVDKFNNKIFAARLNKTSPTGNNLGGIVFYNENGVVLKAEVFDGKYSKSFYLQQNYPNPFNSTTKIQFNLSHNSFVKLRVYDVLGRLVEVVVEKELEAGVHIYDFKANDLPAGLYFYRLEAGNFTQTKKMLLIK